MRALTLIALAAGLSGAAFAAGRWWPRAAPPRSTPSVASAERSRPAGGSPRGDSWRPTRALVTPHRLRATREVEELFVQGRRVDPRFMTAWRADPTLANATRAKVIQALETRRRRREDDVRGCLATETSVGPLTLRMMVEVEARDTELRIESPIELEVSEGAAISDGARACLLAALAGTDDVIARDGERFLASYQGQMDYVTTVERPAE